MTFSHRGLAGLALLSLTTAVGCASEQEETGGSSQDIVATFRNYAPEKAADRIAEHYFPQSLYQGFTPGGDGCALTISRDNANHLVAASMTVFLPRAIENIRFEVHPEIPTRGFEATTVTNWTDKTSSLDFDLKFRGDDGDVDAHVTLLAPKGPTTSLKITAGDRAFECADLSVTRAPIR